MMEGILNQMRRVAEETASARATTRHGTVSSYDPANYAVKVKLEPDGTLTGWLPLKSPWIGNGWGLFCAPSIGDAIEVDFQEGDPGVGTAGWRFFNDEERPVSVPSGEMWIVHQSGASAKFTNDGKITLADPSGTVLALTNDGKVTIMGDLSVSGSITTPDDVVGNGVSLRDHTHGGVQTGSGNTGAPN